MIKYKTERHYKKSAKSKCCSLKIVNKINKPPTRLIKKKSITIISIGNKEEIIITGLIDIKKIIRKYYEQLYANEFIKSDEIDECFEK